MKSVWYQLIENPTAVKSIFGDEIPRVSEITVKEITFSPDGPRINVKFDLSVFPKKPPIKWAKANANTVELELEFIEVSRVIFENWSNNNSSSLVIDDNELSKHVNFVGVLSFDCNWAALSAIKGYANGS